MSSILSLSDVTVAFGELLACDSVSFEQEEGELLAIIGPNGAGKTTVLSAISGVYVPRPGASIKFAGGDDGSDLELIGRKPHQIVRLGLSRTLQNLGLFPGLSVFENLLMGRYVHQRQNLILAGMFTPGIRRDEVEQRRATEDLVDLLDLREYLDEDLEALPYGVQKRIELGRALAMRPRLLLLDEPVAGMNRPEKFEMTEALGRVRAERGTTLLLIEHDMEFVMGMADRLVVLNHGQMIAEGTPDEVQANPLVIEAYLGADDEDSLVADLGGDALGLSTPGDQSPAG